MKKIISFILALTLCIGILPTFAFAATAEEFVVDFTQTNYTGWFNAGKSAARKEAGNGVEWTANGDKKQSTLLSNDSRVAFYVDFLQMSMNTSSDITYGCDTLLFTISVPKSGIYDISTLVGYSPNGPKLNVSLDGNVVKNGIELHKETADNGYEFIETNIGSEIHLSKGTHTLSLKLNVSADAPQNGYAYYVAFKNFTFTPVDGKFVFDFGEATDGDVVNGTVVSGDGWSTLSNKSDSTFLIRDGLWEFYGDYTQAQTGRDYYGTGDRDSMAFTITVPQSGVYDVSANLKHNVSSPEVQFYIDGAEMGTQINLYGEGDAFSDTEIASGLYLKKGDHKLKVQIKNAVADYVWFQMKNITFTENAEKFAVDFTTATVGGDSSTSAARYLTHGVEAKGENWIAISDRAVSTIMNGDKNATLRSEYLQLYIGLTSDPPRDTIAFKIQIPETDVYDISLVAGFGNGSGAMDMYLDSAKIASKMDFYNQNALSFREVDVKKGVYLTAGEHTFKFVGDTSPVSGTMVDAYIKHLLFAKSDVEVITPDADSMKVSFAETTNIAGFTGITVSSVARGASVKLTAHKQNIEGYKFVGWKRGADTSDDNAWVDITGDTYNVWTNTYLTAIYEPIAEEGAKVVEFWNQNGAYLGKATEATYAEDVQIVPTLTGFGTFLGWFTDGNVRLTAETELKAGTTNAVAQYDASAVSGVMLNGEVVEEANAYNKAIPLTMGSGSTCWKRGGNIISYDANYTYYVWGATNITEDDDVIADKVPVAILEYNDDHKAYMLEYDDGDYEIVEAGILFGGNLTVDSCTKKYTSQRKVSHNQFTVPKGDYSSAKGYIIWKDAFGAFHIDYYTVQ